MEGMKVEIDVKGLLAAFAMAGIAVLIFAVGDAAIQRRQDAGDSAPPAPESAATAEEPEEENEFYLDPPGDRPVFLSRSDVAKKQSALIWEKRDFVFADLDAMRVILYASGTPRSSLAIAAKPEQGSFFEMPDGFYAIQGKAERHNSKISKAGFPWTVYLYGNYLIHAEVPRQKTAGLLSSASRERVGGIRLASDDAKTLFRFARPVMPILVSGGATPADISFAYFRKTVLPHSVPEVSAASLLAADLETGQILFEKNKNDAFPIASVSKLVTALVALERIPPSRLLVVGSEALREYGNAAGLVKGEIFRADELLYGMMLPSSNNAAKMYELAVPDFIPQMNEKAREIGMAQTRFRDSSGLAQENISSAKDLFTLLQYLDEKHQEILAVTREKSRIASSKNKLKTHAWTNINWPRDDKRFLGGKAGFTDDSLQTMAGIWRVRAAEYGGRKIGIAVLGSRNRISDVRSVIAYLEKNFIYGSAASQAGGAEPAASGAAASEAAIYEALRSDF